MMLFIVRTEFFCTACESRLSTTFYCFKACANIMLKMCKIFNQVSGFFDINFSNFEELNQMLMKHSNFSSLFLIGNFLLLLLLIWCILLNTRHKRMCGSRNLS